MTYYPGGGGGSSSVSTSSDVALNNATSHEVLTYDGGLQKWKNANVSAANVADFASTVRTIKVALRDVTASATLVVTDEYVRSTGSTAISITLPTDATFAVGSVVSGVQAGAGQVTILGADLTSSGTKTRAVGSAWSAIRTSTGWDLSGDLVT